MEKRRWAIGVVLAIIVGVSLFFVAPITDNSPIFEGRGGFISPKVEESGFLLTDLSIQPQKAQPNEIVFIDVSVVNTRDVWGIYNLLLKIDGEIESQKQVELDAGSSKVVSFIVTKADPGSYTVFINGISGKFSVITSR